MTMTRMKTYKPNYKRAEEKALEFVKQADNKELPIKLIKFKNIFNDLEIKKYSWYAKKMGLSISEVCSHLGSEDGCCVFNDKNGKYRILYNDTIENEGRKRWTIAHELGHYALEHHKLHGSDIMKRSPISDEKYDVLEKEANCFARNLIAPPYVIFHIANINPHLIQDICKVSFEASGFIYDFIKNGVRKFGRFYSKEFAEKIGFRKFLYAINNRYYCKVCQCNFISNLPNCCPGCGKDDITKTPYKIGEEFNMRYDGLQVDQSGKAVICPICNNEELETPGSFCKICGTHVVNECSDILNERGYLELEGCGNRLEGNSRYCTSCGNPSTFLVNGLLDPWEEKKANVFPFSTESLPF